MRYPEQLIAGMRKDLTQYGVREVRTPEEVDRTLSAGQWDGADGCQFGLRLRGRKGAPGSWELRLLTRYGPM